MRGALTLNPGSFAAMRCVHRSAGGGCGVVWLLCGAVRLWWCGAVVVVSCGAVVVVSCGAIVVVWCGCGGAVWLWYGSMADRGQHTGVLK